MVIKHNGYQMLQLVQLLLDYYVLLFVVDLLELKELQKEGLVELKRKEIIIPSLEEVRLYLFSDKQP